MNCAHVSLNRICDWLVLTDIFRVHHVASHGGRCSDGPIDTAIIHCTLDAAPAARARRCARKPKNTVPYAPSSRRTSCAKLRKGGEPVGEEQTRGGSFVKTRNLKKESQAWVIEFKEKRVWCPRTRRMPHVEEPPAGATRVRFALLLQGNISPRPNSVVRHQSTMRLNNTTSELESVE